MKNPMRILPVAAISLALALLEATADLRARALIGDRRWRAARKPSLFRPRYWRGIMACPGCAYLGHRSGPYGQYSICNICGGYGEIAKTSKTIEELDRDHPWERSSAALVGRSQPAARILS